MSRRNGFCETIVLIIVCAQGTTTHSGPHGVGSDEVGLGDLGRIDALGILLGDVCGRRTELHEVHELLQQAAGQAHIEAQHVHHGVRRSVQESNLSQRWTAERWSGRDGVRPPLPKRDANVCFAPRWGSSNSSKRENTFPTDRVQEDVEKLGADAEVREESLVLVEELGGANAHTRSRSTHRTRGPNKQGVIRRA